MANITALLAALSNLPTVGGAPLTPLPGTAQPPTDFNLPMSLAGPEPPPGAPAAPLDQSIIQRYLALAGPAPSPPPPMAPVGVLDKIAAALSGVSAGFQGQGPQYAASLREERLRPQREFEARQQQYEQQRRQLGLRGLEAAESVEERRQARETATAERRYQQDYKRLERDLDLRDDAEKLKLQDLLLSKRQREDDERQFARQQAAQKAQQERDARLFASKFSAQGAKGSVAKELGDYYAGLTDRISDVAAKWESASAKANDIRAAREARIAAGGGGGGGGSSSAAAQKTLAQFESIKQQVADAVARGDATAEMQLRRTMNAAFTRLSRFPGQFDLSYDQTGQWPTATPRTGARPQPTAPQPTAPAYQSMGIFPSMMPPTTPPQQQAAPATGGKTITMDQLKSAARQAGISVDAAVKQFREAGYSMRP